MQNRKQTTKVWFIQRMTVLWFALSTLLAGSVLAETYTWSTNTTGAAQDGAGAWNNTVSNWVGAGDVHALWNNANGDTAVFGAGGAGGTVTADSGITLGGLTFNAITGSAYTLAGGPLILTNAPTITANTNATISGVLAGSVGFVKSGAGALTLNAGNTFTGNVVVASGTLIGNISANTVTPTAASLGNMMVTGRTVTVQSGAKLVFNKADSLGQYQYKTPVTLVADNGTIANGYGCFMSIGDIRLLNGATLLTDNGAADAFQAFNLRGSITVAGTSGSFITAVGSARTGIHLGGTTIPGTLFDISATGDPVADLTINVPLLNEVYNTGALVKIGAGKMVLAADSSYSGGTTVSNGILQVGNGGAAGTIGAGAGTVNLVNADAALVFDRSGIVTQSGAISGNGSLVKKGASLLTLSGVNTYAGGTTVSNGVLAVTTANALPGYATAGKVTVGNGAGLSVGVGSWSSAAITALINAGAFTNGSIFGFDTTAGNYTYSGQFALPAVAGLVKTGPNALTFPGGTGFAGSVNVLGGILQAEFGAGIPATTNVVLNNGSLSSSSATITASLGTGAGQITLTPSTAVGFSAVNTPLTVNLGGAGDPVSWGSSTFNPSVFVLNDTGANAALTFTNAIALNATRTINVNASVAEISAVLSNGSVTAGLVKGGAGTLKLSAANTYSGGTTISAGTLALTGGNDRLNTAGALALNAGTLDLGGNTQAMTSGAFTMANGTTLQNGTINYFNTYWGPNTSASVTFGAGGGFNSLGRLLLNDSQTLTLASGAGASSFAGDGAGACNFIGVDRINANTVVVNGGSLNFTNMASGAGYLRIGMTGSSVVKSTGTLTVNNGAVNIGHSMSMGTKYDMSLAQALGVATLNINGGDMAIGTGSATAFSYGIYGGLYLGNDHASTISLSTVNLNGGTLSLAQLDGGAYGANTVNFNGGILKARTNNTAFVRGKNLLCNISQNNAKIDTAGYTVGVDASVSGFGSLSKQGEGTLVLSGNNTYNDVTTVEAGKLTIAAPLGEPHLKLHLDASDSSTLFTNATGVGAVMTSGQPVGYWGDLSGNNKPALQTVPGQRPTYTNSVAEFSGKAALLFDGSDDDLNSLLDINATNLPNMTVIMVFRQVSIKLSGGLWGHDNGTWDRLQLLNYGSIGANNISTDNNSAQVKGMNTNAVLIYSAVLKNGVPNGSYVYINGVSDSNTGLPGFTSKETDNGAPSLTIGKIGPGATYYPGHILIGEVLVYDTALGDAARRNVEASLRNKWLGASDPIQPVIKSTATTLSSENLSSLKLRLDASVASSLYTNATGVGAVTTAGQPVGYWGDLSGNNKPAVQAALSSRPTYTNSADVFNGLPVLQFDGSDDDITSALDINTSSMPNMTIMMVYRQVAKTPNSGLWGHDNGGWDRLQLLNYSGGAQYDGYPIATVNDRTPVKGMNTNAVLIYTASLKNGVANGSYVYINGTSDANTGLPAFTSTDSGGYASLTLGNISSGNGFRGNIQIGEVLVFNTALSDTARINAEAYLKNKWISLPGRVNIANGAVLDLDGASQTLTSVTGAGTISNGTLTVSEPLSPAGDSIGTLKAANMAFNATLRINVDLDGSCDQLVGSGNLNLTGLTLQIADTNLLNKAKRYTIVNCSGTLTGELTASLPTNWRLYYDRTAGAGTATLVYIPPGTMIRFK